jgi:hypothetical protein
MLLNELRIFGSEEGKVAAVVDRSTELNLGIGGFDPARLEAGDVAMDT